MLRCRWRLDGELVSPEFEVDGLPCKSKKDIVTAGVGLPRGIQFIVKMRVGEHCIDAVRRKEKDKELHEALAWSFAAILDVL